MATDHDPRPNAAEPPAPLPATPRHPLSGAAAWLPWMLLAAAVALGLSLLDRRQPGPAAAQVPARSVVTPRRVPLPAEAAGIQPRLQVDVRHGLANVNGQLAEADRTRLDAALAKTFGSESVHGDIVGDAMTPAADWLDGLVALLPELKARDARIAVDGGRARADLSAVPAGARAALSDRIRVAFGALGIDGLEASTKAPADAGEAPRKAAAPR